MNPTLAKALGVKWGLQTGMELNLQKVVIESDAAEVVNCINRKSSLAAIDPIIQDCWDIMNLLGEALVVHIRRNANSAAHGMVGVTKLLGSRTWVGNAPTQINPIICNDFGLQSKKRRRKKLVGSDINKKKKKVVVCNHNCGTLWL